MPSYFKFQKMALMIKKTQFWLNLNLKIQLNAVIKPYCFKPINNQKIYIFKIDLNRNSFSSFKINPQT